MASMYRNPFVILMAVVKSGLRGLDGPLTVADIEKKRTVPHTAVFQ
jgi:hypothetical protein